LDKIRLMLADDNQSILQLLTDFFARMGDIDVVAAVSDGTEILDAVRYHTTGRAGMTLPEIVLYLADFTSADRNYPDVDEMRRLSDVSLEEAMQYGIAYTIQELVKDGRAVHPDTLAAYNEIVLSTQNKGGQTDEKH